MTLDGFFDALAAHGVQVAAEQRAAIARDLHGERVFIRKTLEAANRKAAVIDYGTSVPATFVARKIGVSVQYVRKVRRLLRA